MHFVFLTITYLLTHVLWNLIVLVCYFSPYIHGTNKLIPEDRKLLYNTVFEVYKPSSLFMFWVPLILENDIHTLDELQVYE